MPLDQVLESAEIDADCQGKKLSIRSRMLPPARSFSAVDIFDMSKPDEPEPSMHRSFQPPRARAAGCFSRDIQEATRCPSQTPCPGYRSTTDVRDRAGHGDRTADRRHPRAPRGRLERRWERDRERRGRDDRRCLRAITRVAPAREPCARNHHAAAKQSDRRHRGDHRPPEARDPRTEQAVAGARPRPGAAVARRATTAPATAVRDPVIARSGSGGVVSAGSPSSGEALGTEHTAPDRHRARETDGLLTRAAEGDRRSARVMDASLVSRRFASIRASRHVVRPPAAPSRPRPGARSGRPVSPFLSLPPR